MAGWSGHRRVRARERSRWCRLRLAAMTSRSCGGARADEAACPAGMGSFARRVVAWVETRRSIASRLSLLPVRVTNSGSCGRPARSFSHRGEHRLGGRGEWHRPLLAALAFAVNVRAGAERTSPQSSAISSETRSPAWIVRVSIARSRRPSQRAWSGASISALASLAVRKVTVRFSKRLGGIDSTRRSPRRALGDAAPRI